MRSILVFLLTLTAVSAQAGPVRIVASTTDLASIAAEIGGAHVDVAVICRPSSDPHRVEVLPSYMVRVSRARLYLKVGMGLDPWADAIIDGSHNGGITVVDCSRGVHVLEKPEGKVDASMGDIHPAGNPHYWLDPGNGAVVAETIAAALSAADPAHAAEYAARAVGFAESARAAVQRGKQVVKQLPNRNIITYHRSWSYFADAFGLEVLSTVEPVPGIPPTGKHLQELLDLIGTRGAVVLIQEPYFSGDAARFLNRETGIGIATVSASCDEPAAGSYLRHFDDVLAALKGLSVSTAAEPGGRH